jgi:hypothetical protein
VLPSTQVQPSLAMPLQLSSLPGVQASAVAGPTLPVQVPQALVLWSVATTQLWVPALHRPLPSCPACSPHGRVVVAAQTHTASSVLSGIPSQSLSAADVQSRAAE